MTNKTGMVSVPRELLENLIAKAYDEKSGNPDYEIEDLRRLLAAPAEDVRAVVDEPVAILKRGPLVPLSARFLASALDLPIGEHQLYGSQQRQVVMPEKYDDVLLPFLKLMRAELHANAHKGDRPGWLSMDRKTAVLEVFYHMGKLHQAVHRGEAAAIREYAADVANMRMMLTDVCGCLDEIARLNPE